MIAAVCALAQQPARVEGTVVSELGGPIRRATVTLQSTTAPKPGTPPTVYVEVSDAQGHFTFESLPAGRFLLSAQKTGFAPGRWSADNGSAQVMLNAGSALTDAVIHMTPNAVIAGTVLDSEGEPAQGISVRLMKLAYAAGRLRLTPGAAASTDDRGQFRMSDVQPGRYYLQTEDATARHLLSPNMVAGESAQEVNLNTFYPADTDVRRATAVEAKAGAEVSGIQIRMQRGHLYSIRGKVVDASGGPAANTALSIASQTGAGMPVRVMRSTGVSREGAFDFSGLAPGEYVIVARPGPVARRNDGQPGPAPLRAGARLVVRITASDVSDVVVTLGPGAEITGRVRLENGDLGKILAAPPVAANRSAQMKLAVSLEDVMGVGFNNARSEVQEDATFRFTSVTAGAYTISFAPAPQGVYLKSVLAGGHELGSMPLDLSAGTGGSLELVLATDAGALSGTVRSAQGDPLPRITVAAWPKTPRGFEPTSGVHTAETGGQGAFSFGGLAPGEYYLAAFEEIDRSFASAYEFLAHFNASAAEVEVGSNAQVTAEPRWIPRDAVEAQMGLLP